MAIDEEKARESSHKVAERIVRQEQREGRQITHDEAYRRATQIRERHIDNVARDGGGRPPPSQPTEHKWPDGFRDVSERKRRDR